MTRVSRNQRELLRQLDAAVLSLFKQAQSLTPLAGVYGVDSDWMRPAFRDFRESVHELHKLADRIENDS